VFGWLSPRLLASSSVAPCFDVVEVLQTAQGAIFPIADAVKIILENHADIDQWFPKGSRTVRMGARAKSTASNYLSPFVQTGPAFLAACFCEQFPMEPEIFFWKKLRPPESGVVGGRRHLGKPNVRPSIGVWPPSIGRTTYLVSG